MVNLKQVEQDFNMSEDDAERKELLLSVMQDWTRRYNNGTLTWVEAYEFQRVAERMVIVMESEK